MSSLNRYKKAGGFVQLLSLIETFGPQKKEKFLEMIGVESLVWGNALREKMLTLERIFSWPDQVVIEVLKSLPLKNMAVVMEGLKDDQKARMMVFFSASEKRKMEDTLVDKPKPEEINANIIKVVELTRKMMMKGDLRCEKFDGGLLIPEEFESKLEHMGASAIAAKIIEVSERPAAAESDASHSHAHTAPHAAGVSTAEVGQLQRSLTVMAKENKTLKDEVKVLREKLDQIRRIA